MPTKLARYLFLINQYKRQFWVQEQRRRENYANILFLYTYLYENKVYTDYEDLCHPRVVP